MQKRQYTIMSTFLFILILMPCSVMSEPVLTIFYAGEEQGQLSLHGCGSEQVGGLAHRHTLLLNLRNELDAVLNLHTGNLIDAADGNLDFSAEWIYQIGLSALDAIGIEVLCLGPHELSFSSETLAALHTNHPNIAFTCANAKQGVVPPYLIQKVSSMNVAVVGLISETYTQEPYKLELTKPHTALAELKAEIVDNSDIVVVVYHATQDEAQTLVDAMPWMDVLIVANGEQPATLRSEPMPYDKGTAIVVNATEGAAVGALSVKTDKKGDKHRFENRYHNVSEEITPDANISHLLEAYVTLTSTSESFETREHQEADNGIHIVYFHKQGCQKCARAVQTLKKLKEKYPKIVVDQRNAKTEQVLFEAMSTLYDVPELKRLTTPAVFIGDSALIGELNEQRLEDVIQTHRGLKTASGRTASVRLLINNWKVPLRVVRIDL